MGHRIKYVHEASEDLDRIHDYIVQNFYSETIAKSTISKIVSGIRILGSNPYTGVNEQANILRILNAKQDYMKFLNDFSSLEQG